MAFSKREKIFLGVGVAILVLVGVFGIIFANRDKEVREVARDMSSEIAQFTSELEGIRDKLSQAQDNTQEAVDLRNEYEQKLKDLSEVLAEYKKALQEAGSVKTE